MLDFVLSNSIYLALVPPTIYYSKVGFELSKLVIRGQKMSPPYVVPSNQQLSNVDNLLIEPLGRTIEAFQSYLTSFTHIIRNPNAFFGTAKSTADSINIGGILSRIRNVNTQQLASLGIIIAEILGFFTIGEMIGRFKLIGYRGDTEHH